MRKFWLQPGAGRKQCLNCGVYVPSRSQHCVCGWDFSDSPPAPKHWVVVRCASGGAVVEEGDMPAVLKNEQEIIGEYDYFRFALDAATKLASTPVD